MVEGCGGLINDCEYWIILIKSQAFYKIILAHASSVNKLLES